jgi:hypothetical protein
MARMAVAPRSIVKGVDVVEDVCPGQISGFIDALADALLFQAAEQRFRDSIIPAVATSTHTRFKIIGLTQTGVIIAPILPARSECPSTGFSGLRCHTTIDKASAVNWRDKVGFIDQPTTLCAKRSTTTPS